MRNLALLAATFLIMATAAYSQKSAVSASANEVSQKDERQIRQLEEESKRPTLAVWTSE